MIAFSLFPVTIRYGRAFQPDALMLGAVLAGLNCWDRAEHGRGRWWLIAGWFLLVLGFAAKVTAAFVLVPLAVVIMRPQNNGQSCSLRSPRWCRCSFGMPGPVTWSNREAAPEPRRRTARSGWRCLASRPWRIRRL